MLAWYHAAMRFKEIFPKLWPVFKRTSLFVISALLLGGSNLNVHGTVAHTRLSTRALEFNFLGWTIESSFEKLSQLSLHPIA